MTLIDEVQQTARGGHQQVHVFITGLVMSGATAIPLEWELDLLTNRLGITGQTSAMANSEVVRWLLTARAALQEVSVKHPLLFYGTDWLAFGHIVIANAFVGALRDRCAIAGCSTSA